MLTTSRIYRVFDRRIKENWEVCGIANGRGNRSTRKKPAPVPLLPLQIPPDLSWV
jgi:hypothetical protein